MNQTPKKFKIEEILSGYPPRTNFNIIQLDGRYNVRIARISGRFPWHRHTNGDEGWLVWKGRVRVELQGGAVIELSAGEGTHIPRGIFHSPVCLEEDTIVVLFNIKDFDHQYLDEAPDVGDFAEHSSY